MGLATVILGGGTTVENVSRKGHHFGFDPKHLNESQLSMISVFDALSQ